MLFFFSADGRIPKQMLAVEQESQRTERQMFQVSAPLPFVIEPGFRTPEFTGFGRFLIAFGTVTTFSTKFVMPSNIV